MNAHKDTRLEPHGGLAVTLDGAFGTSWPDHALK
jgi:hypothetical protein